jgi:CDP-diacylglycerol--glycerol-3-phosphate 3-phosphatidyltransferase
MNLPNLLTLFRIFVSPIFLLVYLSGQNSQALPYILLFILVISEISDGMDGYFARRYNMVSDLGKILDPMADSLYRISVFLTFTLPPVSIPLILVFIFIYRDSVISTLRTICALRGFALGARTSGKIKAVVQGMTSIAIVTLMIPYSLGQLQLATLQVTAFWLTLFAGLYTLYSAVDYFIANWPFIRKAFTKKQLERPNMRRFRLTLEKIRKNAMKRMKKQELM